MTTLRLALSREQILAYRRRAGALDRRLPPGPDSLRTAAWAGLQDSMPRAALVSIHARVDETGPDTWEDPSLVQVWGPRYSAYVIAARDLAVFTLGRLPDNEPARRRAEAVALRLQALLGGQWGRYAEVGRALGVHPNSLRSAAPTGTVIIRWDAARGPTIRTVPAPQVEPHHARLELARRYLHIFGPSTAPAFARWAGIRPEAARATIQRLAGELTPARTPVGDAWILSSDVAAFRLPAAAPGPARLLPSGDTYFLLQGVDRELLVLDPRRRRELWTPRVWPGAVLVDGEIAGTWRRAAAEVTVVPWRRLSRPEREAVEAEAASLPVAGGRHGVRVRWTE